MKRECGMLAPEIYRKIRLVYETYASGFTRDITGVMWFGVDKV